MIFKASLRFQRRYRFCTNVFSPSIFLIYMLSFLPGVVYVMSLRSNTSNKKFSWSSLNVLYFCPLFPGNFILNLNFYANSPTTSNRFRGLNGRCFSVLLILRWYACLVEKEFCSGSLDFAVIADVCVASTARSIVSFLFLSLLCWERALSLANWSWYFFGSKYFKLSRANFLRSQSAFL